MRKITNGRLLWTESLGAAPLCDVPWLGNSVVLSNGDVNFCCFSDAVAGNVNEAPFEEIWNGEMMRTVRTELAEGRLPVACRSASCPIFRGDKDDYVHQRMEGSLTRMFTGNAPPDLVRTRLRAVRMSAVRARGADGHVLRLGLTIELSGDVPAADIVAAVRYRDGIVRFLPDGHDCPAPFALGIALCDGDFRWEFPLGNVDEPVTGDLELCVALFERDADPSLEANCYWSDRRTLTGFA